MWRIGFVAVVVACFAIGLFFYELNNGASLLSAGTMAVNVLVSGQLFYLFNSRFIMRPSTSFRDLVSNRAAILAYDTAHAHCLCTKQLFQLAVLEVKPLYGPCHNF